MTPFAIWSVPCWSASSTPPAPPVARMPGRSYCQRVAPSLVRSIVSRETALLFGLSLGVLRESSDAPRLGALGTCRKTGAGAAWRCKRRMPPTRPATRTIASASPISSGRRPGRCREFRQACSIAPSHSLLRKKLIFTKETNGRDALHSWKNLAHEREEGTERPDIVAPFERAIAGVECQEIALSHRSIHIRVRRGKDADIEDAIDYRRGQGHLTLILHAVVQANRA